MNSVDTVAAGGGNLAVLRRFLADVLRGRGETSRTGRGAMAALAIRVLSAGIAYVSQVLLARWMGAYEFGIFAYVWVWVIMLGLVSALGLNVAVLRFVPDYLARGQGDLARGFIRGSRWLGFATASIFAGVGLGLVHGFPGLVDGPFVLPLTLAALCLPLFNLTDINEGVARSRSWIVLALAPPYILRPLLLIAVLAASAGAGVAVNAVVAVSAALAATWITAFIQMWRLDRRLAVVLPAGPRRYDFPLWMGVALPVFMVESFQMVLTNTDILILTRFEGPGSTALYFAAVKTAGLISFIHFAVSAAVLQNFARIEAEDGRQRLGAYLKTAIGWIFWPSLAVAAVMLGFGGVLLDLFGAGFADAWPAMAVLLAGLLARAAVGPADFLLNTMGQQKLCALIFAGAGALNIVLNILLVPRYGLTGAALATMAAHMVVAAALYGATRRRLGLHSLVI